MRRAALALMWAGAILAAACPALGQRAEVGGDPAAFESASEMLRLSERYKNVCSELRANKISDRSPLKDVSADHRFVAAIIRFCASGDFLLEQRTEHSWCDPDPLEKKHLEFIAALSIMRSEPARRIVLECVKVAERERLQFRMLQATVLVLRRVTASEVYIYFSKLANGVRLQDSDIQEGFRINGVAETGPIIIATTTIGSVARRGNNALQVRNSALDLFEARNSTFDGNVVFDNVTVKADIQFIAASILGNLDLEGERIGGRLVIQEGSAILGSARLQRLSADGLSILASTVVNLALDYAQFGRLIEISASTFLGAATLTHIRVEGALIAHKESYFARLLSLDNANVNSRILMDSVFFGAAFSAERAQVNLFELRNVDAGANIILTGIVARTVTVVGTEVRGSLFLGNARLHVLNVFGRKIGLLDCSDCIIEQYAFLAAEYEQGVRLAGARILGSLIFSFRDRDNGFYRAAWNHNAVLDLTGARAQTVEADDVDLQLKDPPPDCKDQLVRANLSGFTFDQFIGGRHTNQPNTSRGKVVDRNVADLRNWIRGRPSCWSIAQLMPEKANYQQRFDPQPFETFATALERSGRGRDAVELRIAKREEEITASNPPRYERFYLEVGRWLVGYGYKNELALLWMVALAIFGTAVFLWSQPPALLRRKHWLDKFFYSLFFSIDRLVPQLIVHGEMSEFEGMGRMATHYFYAHRVIGAIILIYAVAGLTGVLK